MTTRAARAERRVFRRMLEIQAAELLASAWGVIANAGNGDWTTEPQPWQAAAEQWRDRYHAWLADAEAGPPPPEPDPAAEERLRRDGEHLANMIDPGPNPGRNPPPR